MSRDEPGNFQAIFTRTGERYEPGTAREVFGLWGLAGGATDDWYITQVHMFSSIAETMIHEVHCLTIITESVSK